MRSHHLHPILFLILIAAATAQAAASLDTTTNGVSPSRTPVVQAPPLPAPAPKPQPDASVTNTDLSLPATLLDSTLTKEIQVTDTGAEARWGRLKALFPSDLGSPISVVTADGRNLSFRPTFLVLENRAKQETVLLGAVTNNGAGTIYLPDSIVWTNIFDAGPRVDVEYVYDAVRGLEQNLICREAPNLPSGWLAGDAVLECWTEWWMDSGSASVESRTVTLRTDSGTNSAVQAEDSMISFGASRITAGGKAFSAGSDSETLPVAKSWIQTTPQGAESPRRFLIESLDFMSARSKFAMLPKPTRQASVTQPKSGRADLLRLHARAGDGATKRQKLLIQKSAPSKKALVADARKSNPQLPVLSYQHSTAPGLILDFTLQNAVPLPSGAISWWPAGGNALDALANHNNGTLAGNATFAAGEVGQGFSLDGGNESYDYIQVPNAASLNPTNGLTVEAWIYIASLGSDQPIVSKDSQDENRQYLLTVTYQGVLRGYVGITNGNFYYTEGSSSLEENEWYHVAMTYNPAVSNLSVYVNGTLDGAALVSGTMLQSSEPFSIGGVDPEAYPDPHWFAGVIDEVGLFSRALSASEIQAIYNAGPAGKINPNCIAASTNAVAWWPGDSNAYDIAHTNMGTLRNGASFASGVVGQGFSFDGGNDYARIENNWDLNPTNAITLEGWVWMDHYDYNHAILRKDGECANRQYMLSASISGKFRAHVGLTNGSYYAVDSTTSVAGQTWYHVAEVYNQTNLCVYVNGVLEASAPLTGRIVQTTEPVFIGGSGGYCWDYNFPGVIDEFTIYNRALSDTEISAIYSAGCAGKCKNYVAGDLFTDLQNLFLGFGTNTDYDGDGVLNGTEWFQGRNPRIASAAADTNNVINLQVYTPLK